MIYIIRGTSNSAKNFISCSLSEFLTAQPINFDVYTIIPDRNNSGDIRAIFKEGKEIYKSENDRDWIQDAEDLRKEIKGKGTKKIHIKEYFLPSEEEENLDIYHDFLENVKEELKNNINLVCTTNIYGKYLESFKNEMSLINQGVKVISILRNPITSFLLKNNENIFIDEDKEDNCKNIRIFDILHFLKIYEKDNDYIFKYEDIISNGIIEVEGIKVLLNKGILAKDSTNGINDWEEENIIITDENKKNAELIKKILTTKFDEFVEDNSMPKNILEYFGY